MLQSQSRNVDAALGFGDIFSESNRDDMEEMLDIITDKSGGMFDAVADLNDALERGDASRLNEYKERFQDYSVYKYGGNESVSGGNSAASLDTKRDRRTDSKVDAIQAEIDEELSKQTKDINKIAELNVQLRKELDTPAA